MMSDFFEFIFAIVVVIIVAGLIGLVIWSIFYPATAGNKVLLDTKYTFTKAITNINGEQIEIEIDKWADFEGEQIQIISKDGIVYLLSMNNTILIGE